MVRAGSGMTAVAVTCGLVFAGSLYFSWRLARFLKDCDDRQAAAWADHPSTGVVAEAEAIVRHAYSTDPTTWP